MGPTQQFTTSSNQSPLDLLAGSFHRILERSVAENPAMEGQSEHVSRTQHFAFERQPDITGQAVVFPAVYSSLITMSSWEASSSKASSVRTTSQRKEVGPFEPSSKR